MRQGGVGRARAHTVAAGHSHVILPDRPCESRSSEDPGPFSCGNCEAAKFQREDCLVQRRGPDLRLGVSIFTSISLPLAEHRSHKKFLDPTG